MRKLVIAAELCDETNDPNETVNLADRPKHGAVIESLSRHLPPLSASAISKTKSKE